jgi:hypothetical protein
LQIRGRAHPAAGDNLAHAAERIADADDTDARRQLREQAACRVAAQQLCRRGDVRGEVGRIEGTELGDPVRDLGKRHERHVERAGLQLLQHLRVVAELARRKDRDTVPAARTLTEFGGEILGGDRPDMPRRGRHPKPEAIGERRRRQQGDEDNERAEAAEKRRAVRPHQAARSIRPR